MTEADVPGTRHADRGGKPFLVMLAAHAVQRDPRVVWEIASAEPAYDVLAFGLAEGQPEERRCDSATVRHVVARPGDAAPVFAGAWAVLAKALRRRGGYRHLPITVAALAVFLPLAALLGWERRKCPAAPIADVAEVPVAGGAPQGAVARIKAKLQSLPTDSFVYQSLRFLWLCRHLLLVTSRFHHELRGLGSRRPSIVHANDFDTLIVAAMYKAGADCRLVYDAHEFWPYSHTHAGRLQRWFFTSLERLFIGEADRVLTINPLMAGMLERTYGLAGKVDSLINAEPWRDGRQPYAHPLPQSIEGKVRFLFIGNFTPSRGLEELVDAWAESKLDNAVLILRGPDSSSRRQLEQHIASLGRSGESIMFLPPVQEEDLIAVAQQVDVGVIPYKPIDFNYRYCCPNKLSQYLHAGVMVLAGNTEFVSGVVGENGVGLVYDPEDRASVVSALKQAAGDAKLRARCRDNALALAKGSFNWQTQERILLKAYAGN